MSSSPWLPYFFFLYMFVSTWVMMMNYDKIKGMSSSPQICYGFISITIGLLAFIGSAALYNIDNKECDYHEKIRELY